MLQYNQNSNAEKINQCQENDLPCHFTNEEINRMDEKENKKETYNNVQKSNNKKISMRIKRSNESVKKRNKRLQLDRVQHMKKQKRSKTVNMCNDCMCNTKGKREEIYAKLMHPLKL